MATKPIEGQQVPAQALAQWLMQVKKQVILLMGLPASGKSTLCVELEKLGAKRINKDSIRKRLYGDESKQGDWRQVSAEYYKELKAAFATGGTIASDNVNIMVSHRSGTIEEALEAGYDEITIVWVDTPLDVCLQRNAARERKVPESAIKTMDANMRQEGPPRESEGNLVVVTGGKDKDHYLVKQIRAGKAVRVPREKPQPQPAPAPVTKVDLAKLLEDRKLLAGKLQAQVTLYEACLQAGRDAWAAETLTLVSQLAGDGQKLFAVAPGGGSSTPAPVEPPKRPWIPPTPEQVQATFLKMIDSRPLVTSEGALVCISFNGHLLTKEKAELHLPALLELVKRGHAIFFQETNVDALRVIARAAHYGLIASHRNSRGQACGILFHPRLHWLGKDPIYHDYLLKMPGHADLETTSRPAVQRRARDLTTGYVLDFINFHGKSNLGGPDATRPIRRWQFEQLMAELDKQKVKSPYTKRELPAPAPAAADGAAGKTDRVSGGSKLVDESGYDLPLGPVVIGGDYNAPIEKADTTEIEPLTKAGFVRVTTTDGRWSYRYKDSGGQFDGFFVRGVDGLVKECFIPMFFPEGNRRDTAFYRELSDHLPVFMVLDLPSKTTPAPVKDAPAPAKDGQSQAKDAPAVKAATDVLPASDSAASKDAGGKKDGAKTTAGKPPAKAGK